MTLYKAALISVYDKEGLDVLVPFLEENDFHIYSTGGTLNEVKKYVKDISIVRSVSDYTEYPEICDGRVKTLHPKIYGGILGVRSNPKHIEDLYNINARLFDLVVVNLYPFEQILKKDPREDVLLENIDIGGHTLLRAAAKNHRHVSILSDPSQYEGYMSGVLTNLKLAQQAFTAVMKYDMAINNWFSQGETMGMTYYRVQPIKYGLNPHMKPAFIYTRDEDKKPPFTILNGDPGYINLLDAHYAIHLVLEVKSLLDVDCCASYKHNSPAGVAIAPYARYGLDALDFARNIDAKSSFGDFIGYSGTVDEKMAQYLKSKVSDGIIAADFTEDALEILKRKKSGNFVILKQDRMAHGVEHRDINGVTLVQPTNTAVLNQYTVLHGVENDQVREDMVLGYTTLKYTQSNCVCFVCDGKVIGIGAGQQNRVDCVRLAGEKAKECLKHELFDTNIFAEKDIVLVSDAFFPFPDNIQVAAEYNVKHILQPGGSIRDNEVEKECKKYGMTMTMSGLRAFTH
jgi:phosphoribosylaminoimidazolecarboxamide formyltransferase/IMP cyclohydrolase